MKIKTYYNTPLESDADICDFEKELCVNCAGSVADGYGIHTKSVRRDFYLMYITDGEMNINFDSDNQIIKSGQMLILKPKTMYFYESDNTVGVEYLWIHFTGRHAKQVLSDLNIPLNKIHTPGMHRNLCDGWQRLFDEFAIHDSCFDMVSSSILKEILAMFSRCINSKIQPGHLFKSLTYINDNFNKNIKTSELAALENMSETHFRVRFKDTVGISPYEYIINTRLNAAKELLDCTNKKINEISNMTGFKDAYYFNRIFKKKIGITPGKWRKNQRGRI